MKTKYSGEYIYLKSNYFEKPKETFKFCGKFIVGLKKKNIKILDIGCARGEFLYYLNSNYKNRFSVLNGIDNSKILIESKKKYLEKNNIKLFKKNISKEIKLKRKYNFITAIGVIECLKNLKQVFRNISKLQDKNSYFLLFGRFNDNEVDIISNFNNYNNVNNWQTTSTWSKKTILKHLFQNNYKFVKEKKFTLPFHLKKDNTDPMRSYTLKVGNKIKFANGLGFLFDIRLLLFKKK